MTLLYVVSICVWTSVALATKDQSSFSDEELASSPLIRNLLERVDILEKHGAKQEGEIQTLKAEMVQQRGDMMKMRLKLKTKDRTIQLLLDKLSKSQEDGKWTSEKLNQADSVTASLLDVTGARKQKRGNANIIHQVENEVHVAFSAGLTTHMLQVGDKQAIKFDKVITNIGNAYNPHHGIFIAPVPGTYVFSTTILSYDSRLNWVYFAVNGEVKSELFIRDAMHTTGSQTMLFELNKGDDVAVLGRAGDAIDGYPLPHSTFIGFLLQQNYSSVGNLVG